MNKKTTTSEQFELLVAELAKNPTMGRGAPIFGSNKGIFNEFWECISFKLNAIGPPPRTANEWKKVWSDLKLRTKKKISENAISMRKTGGGPFFEQELSGVEKSVDEIFSLRSSAIPTGVCFGLNSQVQKENVPTTSLPKPSTSQNLKKRNLTSNVIDGSQTSTPVPKKKATTSNHELLEQQIENQKLLINVLKEQNSILLQLTNAIKEK